MIIINVLPNLRNDFFNLTIFIINEIKIGYSYYIMFDQELFVKGSLNLLLISLYS
jgi:hypothetical protein